jgi:hypothetical protein
MLVRAADAGQMSRMDDQHAVELETHAGTRLHVAHSGKLQRGEDVLIRQPVADARGHLLDQLLARRVFQHPHQRLDVRFQRYDLRPDRRLRG